MTSAVRKIEAGQLSQRALNQLQGLGDVDVDAMKLHVGKTLGINVVELLTDAVVSRSVEGASTVTVNISDAQREVLTSGALSSASDINVDGLWYRMQQVSKSGDDLTLTFEDRVIAILRKYDSKLGPVSRAQLTRAQFILRMIKEPKEITIPVFIPQLTDIQPIAETTAAGKQWTPPDQTGATPSQETQGIPTDSQLVGANQQGGGVPKPAPTGIIATLSVKGSQASKEQINNANTILRVAKQAGARRKVMVAGIMAAIQESSIHNLSFAQSPGNHRGIFQQDPRYWPASGDVAVDAKAFFDAIIGIDRTYPNLTYVDLIEKVQRSGAPNNYSPWRTEAEHFVTAFGEPGAENSIVTAGTTDTNHLAGGSDFFFYRGVPPQQGSSLWKPEDSWTAIQRLASEVGWRAFFVAGKFYYLTEDYLFKSQPRAVVTERTAGVISINFDYDQGKRFATVTISAVIKRWAAPPGSVIVLHDMGPVNGRWLVTDVSRSLFEETGTITLKKPLPQLPEPSTSNLQNTAGYQPTIQAIGGGTQFHTLANVINPIPKGRGGAHGAVHNTDGLDGYPALDFFADPGTPVLAPESGQIQRLSGCDPNLGPVNGSATCSPLGFLGAGGPLGRSIYLVGTQSGSIYFMTHLQNLAVAAGQSVIVGQKLAEVANYDKWGRKSHTHVGVHGGTVNIDDLGTAPQAA